MPYMFTYTLITIIPKHPSPDVEHPEYIYSGRYAKLLTLAAGHASSLFTKLIDANIFRNDV